MLGTVVSTWQAVEANGARNDTELASARAANVVVERADRSPSAPSQRTSRGGSSGIQGSTRAGIGLRVTADRHNIRNLANSKMMQSSSECPKCGSEIPPNLPPGFCPGCALLSVDLAETDDDPQGPPLPGALRPGAAAGRYVIKGALGSGGGGDVYLAEQKGDVALEVAIKVLHASAQNDRMVARFEAERDALMRMNHAGIARVLDAGFLDDGRPFVAMEYVDGEPLNLFIGKQALPLEDRLKLFLQICAAVQHAHAKGVIHRDLKPTNILVVRADHSPKVIDFGIARALDRPSDLDALFTGHAEILGTPAYMSPEQTQGGNADVDVRSDVYALGVILYEILTGHPPVAPKALAEMSIDDALRQIREVDAPKPSSRKPGIESDLDAVALKALSKEPERRYQTAAEFADDLEGFLRNEPVIATPPTTSYRLGKFVRRNRGAVAAGAAILISIIVGAVVSLYQAKQAKMAAKAANEANDLAQRRLDSSEDLIQYMVGDLYQQLRPIGKLDVLGGSAEKVEAFYKELGDENRTAGSLTRQGAAFMQLGRVHSAQGDGQQAISHFEASIAVLKRALEKAPEDEAALDQLSNVWESLATHHTRQRNHEEADLAYSRAAEIVDAAFEKRASQKWRDIAVGIYVNRGSVENGRRQWRKALAYFDRALALANAETPVSTRVLIDQNKGLSAMYLGDLDIAEASTNAAIELISEQQETDPGNTGLIDRRAEMMANLGAILYRRGDRNEDLVALNRKIAAQREQLLELEPNNVFWRNKLAEAYRHLYISLAKVGDGPGAAGAAGRAVATREQLAFQEPVNKDWRQRYLEDVDQFESFTSALGAWKDAYLLRVRTYSISSDPRTAAHKLGRAAAYLSLDGELAPAQRDLANWILQKYGISTEELAKLQWPDQIEGLGKEPNRERLAGAVTSGRLLVPDAWKVELTSP